MPSLLIQKLQQPQISPHNIFVYLYNRAGLCTTLFVIRLSANMAIDEILKNPDFHDVLSIIKGFRNGAVYGMDLDIEALQLMD